MNDMDKSDLYKIFLLIFLFFILIAIREQVVLTQFWRYQASNQFAVPDKEIQSRFIKATLSMLENDYVKAREEFLIVGYRFPGNPFEKSAKLGVNLVEQLSTGKVVSTQMSMAKRDTLKGSLPDTAKIAANKKLVIEVVNACGNQDATDLMTEAIQKAGYDVKRVSTSTEGASMYTKVINNGNATKEARELAKALSINSVYDFTNDETDADITVVVGSDYLKKEK